MFYDPDTFSAHQITTRSIIVEDGLFRVKVNVQLILGQATKAHGVE